MPRPKLSVDVDAMVFWRQEGLGWQEIQHKMNQVAGHPRVSSALIRQRVLAVDPTLARLNIQPGTVT